MTESDMRGAAPESWACIDCKRNTAPGCPTRAQVQTAFLRDGENMRLNMTIDERSEVYTVREKVWKAAGMGPHDGCLCIDCLEKRIRRRLKPEDFPRNHPFYSLPGTDRLQARRSGAEVIRHRDGSFRFPDGERCEDAKALTAALQRRREAKQ